MRIQKYVLLRFYFLKVVIYTGYSVLTYALILVATH